MFGSLSGLFLITSVDALVISQIINFDDGVALNQYSNANIATHNYTTGSSLFYLSSDKYYSNGLSFKCAKYTTKIMRGWWNYTSDLIMTEWNAYLNIDTTAGINNGIWQFKNETNVTLIELQIIPSTKDIRYYNGVTTGILNTSYTGGGINWQKIGWILCQNGTIDYYYGTTHIYDNPYHSSSLTGVKYVYFNNSAVTDGIIYWVDENKITYGFSSSLSSACDLSAYSTLGSYPDVIVIPVGNVKLRENKYSNKFSGDIYGIDIFCGSDFNSDWSTNWYLSINGFTHLPTCFYNYSFGSYTVNGIRYSFIDSPISVNDAYLAIESYADIINPYTGNYYRPLYSSDTTYRGTSDVDQDGISESKYGSASSSVNGAYDAPNTINYEFFYILYYIGSSGSPIENTTAYNFLNIYGERLTNSSTTKLFYVNDTVFLSYGLSDITISNRINIKYSSSNITSQGYPRSLFNPKGTLSFSPENVGNYTVYLYSNNIMSIYKYFNVILNPNAEDNAYQIHSIPSISIDYESYTVKYRYYNVLGNYGYIGVFRYGYDTSNFSKNIYNRKIDVNYSGQFIYIPNELSFNNYWQLFVKVGSEYIPKGDTHIHYIMQSDKTSVLNIDYGERYGRLPIVGNPITIYGSHPYVGSDIYIYVNNNQWKYAGNAQEYSQMYIPTKTGSLLFILGLKLDNGTVIILDSKSIIISSNVTKLPSTGLEGFPDYISWTIGLILTMLFFLIPLLVLKNRTDSPIAMGVISFSGFFGLSLSVLFGLLPLWIIAFCFLVVILIIVFIWLSRKIAA
jgi:hypothetical protein